MHEELFTAKNCYGFVIQGYLNDDDLIKNFSKNLREKIMSIWFCFCTNEFLNNSWKIDTKIKNNIFCENTGDDNERRRWKCECIDLCTIAGVSSNSLDFRSVEDTAEILKISEKELLKFVFDNQKNGVGLMHTVEDKIEFLLN